MPKIKKLPLAGSKNFAQDIICIMGRGLTSHVMIHVILSYFYANLGFNRRVIEYNAAATKAIVAPVADDQ